MAYLTDYADGAVVLPVAALVALVLGLSGWWRGLTAWVVAVGGTLAVVLVLKLAGAALVGPWERTPSISGHVASAGVVYGGLAVLLLRGVVPNASLAAVPVALAVLVGLSRIWLGAHSPAEVVAGAVVGCAGALVLAVSAGPRMRMPAWPVVAGVACTVLACHGLHLQSEATIDALVFASR